MESEKYEEELSKYKDKKYNSLKIWTDYLTKNELEYPLYILEWIFNGILEIGSLNLNTGKFNKRSNKTNCNFVDFNAEVLVKVVNKYYNLYDGNSKNELGKFATEYGNSILAYNEQKRKETFSTDGIWIKYNQGSMDDADKLYESLQNRYTGWCTAGEKFIAEQQIKEGDFYVFYVKYNNEYVLPRIAIRMEGHTGIAEIRGILQDQCLEEGLEDVVKEKLNVIENLSEYDKKSALEKCDNLKKLSIIAQKTNENEELSEEEIKLLYIYQKIGFGWAQDKRVDETIIRRCKKNLIENDLLKVDILSTLAYYFEYINSNTKSYKKIALESVKRYPILNEKLLESLLLDKESIEEMIDESIKNHGMTLGAIDTKYRTYERCLMAIENNCNAIEYVPKELLNDEIKIEYLKHFAQSYDGLSNYDICSVALEKDKKVIKYIPVEMDCYNDLVLPKLSKDNTIFKDIPTDTKGYKNLVLECIKKDIDIIKYVPKDMIDFDMCENLLNKRNIKYVPPTIENYTNIIIKLLIEDKIKLADIPVDNRNYDICMAAVKLDGLSIAEVPENLDGYDNILEEAIKRDKYAIEYVNNDLKNKYCNNRGNILFKYRILYITNNIKLFFNKYILNRDSVYENADEYTKKR